MRLSLQEAALLAPILEYATGKLRSDGQRLSTHQQIVVARIVNAEIDYRRLLELVTVTEAAALLGVKERRVRALIDRGQLIADMVDGRWLVERSSVMDRLSAKPATTDTSPPAREREPREPGSGNRHLIAWSDPTGNRATTPKGRT